MIRKPYRNGFLRSLCSSYLPLGFRTSRARMSICRRNHFISYSHSRRVAALSEPAIMQMGAGMQGPSILSDNSSPRFQGTEINTLQLTRRLGLAELTGDTEGLSGVFCSEVHRKLMT